MTALAINGGAPVRTGAPTQWPVHDEHEEEALLRVVRSGNWWSGAYPYELSAADEGPSPSESECAAFGREFALAHDSRYGLAASNGTATLMIILRALGIGPGDEVIVSPYTFIASASTILEVGATAIFSDIDPLTYNLDPKLAEAAITPRTRAIVVVHFAGQSVDLDAFTEIAQRCGIALIEDSAHAHGSAWRGKACGSHGNAGSFSFQASKNMTSGEGGIITTSDTDLAERCHSVIWGGRVRGRPWYEHHILGGNYRLTEFQAAVLRVQLSRLQDQTKRRDANGRRLAAQLGAIPGVTPISLDPRATMISFHLLMFQYSAAEFAGLPIQKFVDALCAEGISCSTGYRHPLYHNPVFTNWTFPYDSTAPFSYADFAAKCPVTEEACHSSVWFPHQMLLGGDADLQEVIDAIGKIQQHVTSGGSVGLKG